MLWNLGEHWWEKLAKPWSSNPETISFPHLFLTATFTTLTCALVHSISGKGPSWRPLPVGFSSSWPLWKYIETSAQDMFQTQIFHCVCIWCLLVWCWIPGCFEEVGLGAITVLGNNLACHLFPSSFKLVLAHAEMPRGFLINLKWHYIIWYLKCQLILLIINIYGIAIYPSRKNKQGIFILQELTLHYFISVCF